MQPRRLIFVTFAFSFPIFWEYVSYNGPSQYESYFAYIVIGAGSSFYVYLFEKDALYK